MGALVFDGSNQPTGQLRWFAFGVTDVSGHLYVVDLGRRRPVDGQSPPFQLKAFFKKKNNYFGKKKNPPIYL